MMLLKKGIDRRKRTLKGAAVLKQMLIIGSGSCPAWQGDKEFFNGRERLETSACQRFEAGSERIVLL